MTDGISNHPPSDPELFREVFELADELAARIIGDEVEARLLRLLWPDNAGQDQSQPIPPCGSADDCHTLADSVTTSTFKPAPAELIQRLHEAHEEAAFAQRSAAVWTAEAARAERAAADARQQAQQIIADAENQADAQLHRAASIVTAARGQAASIVTAARETAAQITETARLQAASSTPGTAVPAIPWLSTGDALLWRRVALAAMVRRSERRAHSGLSLRADLVISLLPDEQGTSPQESDEQGPLPAECEPTGAAQLVIILPDDTEGGSRR